MAYTNFEITGAFEKSSIWKTPIEVQKENYLFLTNESIIKNPVNQVDLSLSNAFPYCNDLTNIDCSGSINTYMHFNDNSDNSVFEHLLYMAMGDESYRDLNAVVSDRLLKVADNNFGKMGTLAFNKILAVHEFPSVKVNGFRIEGNITDISTIEFYLICNDRNIDSTVNTLTKLRVIENYQQSDYNVIIPISLRYGSIYIDDYTYPFTAPITEYPITSFALDFKRNLTQDFVTGSNETLEPMGIISDGSMITLDLVLGYYDTKTFIENFDLQQPKKVIVSFVGPTIIDGLGNLYRYTFLISLYNLKMINENDIINNAGLTPLTLKFMVRDYDPDGPFNIQIISKHKQQFN